MVVCVVLVYVCVYLCHSLMVVCVVVVYVCVYLCHSLMVVCVVVALCMCVFAFVTV